MRIKMYTKKGNKNDIDRALSVDKLMEKQNDFKTEITLLQYHASKLGVSLEQSPKCHPELAREGIEYAWGIAKLKYRQAPLSAKQTSDAFKKLVYECLSADNESVLNITRIYSCSKRARQYMVMYKALGAIRFEEIDGIEVGELVNKHSILESSIKMFWRLTKKKHCGVLDHQVEDIHIPMKDVKESDKKEHLACCVVGKMVTLGNLKIVRENKLVFLLAYV